MNAVNIENLYEECMQRLAAGANLEEVLADFPSQADDLRPMLETALGLQQLASEITVPQSAQMRSRQQFLTSAAALDTAGQNHGLRFSLFHLRLAASTAILVGIFAAILLLGTGLASANSLPGDMFYPVKIMVEQMQIKMVQNPPARIEMEDGYDDRRQQEVVRLTQMQRREQVTFSGFLQNEGDGKWKVGSIPLVFPAGGADPADFEDAYVEIVGMSDDELVEVQSIKLHQMGWEGILQKFDDQSWTISDLTIIIADDTEFSGALPRVGAKVQVVAVRPSGGHYRAVELTVTSLPPTVTKPLPIFSQTPSQESSESKESGENNHPKSTPKVSSPTPEPESKPTRYKETEEENKSKPSPTPTSKSNEEYHPTRTPTSVSKPTKTPTVVPDPTQTPGGHDD